MSGIFQLVSDDKDSRSGTLDGGQRSDKLPLNIQNDQLQKEISRISRLLKGREVHTGSIFSSTVEDAGGAPSNTPVQSPKPQKNSDSNYVTGDGGNASDIKPLKLKAFEVGETGLNPQAPVPHKKFLSINDLLTSENYSTYNSSSPLGDKTIEFINQTTMTGNNTFFLNNTESYDRPKRISTGENSTVIPMNVLGEARKDMGSPRNINLMLHSSPIKAQFGMPLNNSQSSFDTRNRRVNFLDNEYSKGNYGNGFDAIPNGELCLPLSSSPVQNFETKFPEPRPFHELFDVVPVDSHLREDNGQDTLSQSSSSQEEKQYAQENSGDSPDSDDREGESHEIKNITEANKMEMTTTPVDTMEKDSVSNNIVSSSQIRSDSDTQPKFELSSSIRLALRKRKKISYNVDKISYRHSEESPKKISLRKKTKRQKALAPSSSPRRYKHTSSSGSSRSYNYRRKKSIKPRSKSGCWTCRIRKKKCTEERPSCDQCTKLGLSCDGYSEERPAFMMNNQLQRRRLDEIKNHTSQRKKIGVKKVKIELEEATDQHV